MWARSEAILKNDSIRLGIHVRQHQQFNFWSIPENSHVGLGERIYTDTWGCWAREATLGPQLRKREIQHGGRITESYERGGQKKGGGPANEH